MTRQQFTDAVRQYAALALRQRRSYAPQVEVLVKAYMSNVSKLPVGGEREAATDHVENVLTREYAPNDAAFKLPDLDALAIPF